MYIYIVLVASFFINCFIKIYITFAHNANAAKHAPQAHERLNSPQTDAWLVAPDSERAKKKSPSPHLKTASMYFNRFLNCFSRPNLKKSQQWTPTRTIVPGDSFTPRIGHLAAVNQKCFLG